MQVDSIRTRVECAPGLRNQRLKLKCDDPLSNVALNLNLRRYSTGDAVEAGALVTIDGYKNSTHDSATNVTTVRTQLAGSVVGQCRLIVSKLGLKACLVSALETEM